MRSDDLVARVKDGLARSGVSEAEVYVLAKERGFARFAMGDLGQHMHVREPCVTARVAVGRRVAEAVTARLDPEGIVEVLRRAESSARLAPESEAFDGFAGPSDVGPEPPALDRFAARTADATAEKRVELVAPLLEKVRARGFVCAGILETTTSTEAVVTTRGCARGARATTATFKLWATETAGAGGAAGYGGAVHRDVDALDLEGETERAIRICTDSRNPVAMDAGSYDVVFEPEAVSELLEWLSATAFSAADVEQGMGAVAGRKGSRVTGEGVTIVEDPLDAGVTGFGAPFDREGVSRRRVALITAGVAEDILFDRAHGKRMGASSTGSAVPPTFGAEGGIAATSIHLAPGTHEDVASLVAGIDRGLYVCRLHYVNGYVEPKRAVMTGLTRDGCFLVEKGKITRPVGNLRFTESFLEALSRCDGMTKTPKAIPTWWSENGATVTPAVRIRGFRFSSGSAVRS